MIRVRVKGTSNFSFFDEDGTHTLLVPTSGTYMVPEHLVQNHPDRFEVAKDGPEPSETPAAPKEPETPAEETADSDDEDEEDPEDPATPAETPAPTPRSRR